MVHASRCFQTLQIASYPLPAHFMAASISRHAQVILENSTPTVRISDGHDRATFNHIQTQHGFPACDATCAAGALCRIDLSPLRCSTSQALWQAPPAWLETTLEVWVERHLDSQWFSYVRETCLLSDRLEEYLFDEMELKYQVHVPQSADHKSLDVSVPRMSGVLRVSCCSMLQNVLL